MAKTYILYYNYNNTSGNHAGMSYLVRYIAKNDLNIKLIKNIDQEFKLGKYVALVYSFLLALYLRLILKKGDKVFFFEYLMKNLAYHDMIARVLRSLNFEGQLLGLVHLSGDHLLEYYGKKSEIVQRASYLDKVVVFGSSLEKFLTEIGFEIPVIRTFHYVDSDFYSPADNYQDSETLKVLCMGTLKRDFTELKRIISMSPDLEFRICMGRKNLIEEFSGLGNVILYPFLSENELISLIQSSDIGLSVIEDTVGSNVITTSLAGGLVQVVSDVGSIRDYCNSENSFLCKNTNEYVIALNLLQQDRNLLRSMRISAREQSLKFSKESFLKELKRITT